MRHPSYPSYPRKPGGPVSRPPGRIADHPEFTDLIRGLGLESARLTQEALAKRDAEWEKAIAERRPAITEQPGTGSGGRRGQLAQMIRDADGKVTHILVEDVKIE